MVDIHRMVGGLRQLVQDADATTRLRRRAEHRQPELLLADHLRAGEGEQDASGADFLERDGVQLPVALQGVAQYVLVLRESGRVEDDKVVLIAHLAQELKSVLGVGLVARVAGEIQLHVLSRQGDRLRRAVHGVDQFRPASHGVERESARVAEHVQHRAPRGVTLQQAAVFPLVDEETCLLPFLPIHVEA